MNQLENIWNIHYTKLVVTSYWLLGLCNNFAFVIMLSAANDILTPPDSTPNATNHSNPSANSTNKTNKYDCNNLSTGAILLADTIPGIIIKLIAPFFVHKIKYWKRVLFVVIVNSCSFLLVALAPAEYQWLIFVGVGCASLSSDFGEITFLSLSAFYDQNLSMTGWGSGTGAAGLIGSFGYAGLTSLGMTPRAAILSMLFIPILMGFSYLILPNSKFKQIKINSNKNESNETSDNEESSLLKISPVSVNSIADNSESWKDNLRLLKPLFKYMIPLFLVYFSEYFINQGLFELLYFKDSFVKSHKDQYRWYNVVYQLAVFISRSSIRYIKIKRLSLFSLLQVLNVLIAFSQIFTGWMPNIWIAFILIFWEGLLAGGLYVNAFYLVSVEINEKDRETGITIASLATSVGIALAGITSIPAHNAICDYGYL